MQTTAKRQFVMLLAIEVILIILMGLLTEYGPEASARDAAKSNSETDGISIYPICFLQGFLICAFLAAFDYPEATKIPQRENTYFNEKPTWQSSNYPLYQDVHVMIWIGFGFLMIFPKRYGQSALGLTFLVGAILLQVALLFDGVVNINKYGKVPLSLNGLLNADVAVAAPLISMGALLGKTTYMQLIFMGIIELAVYTANKYVGEHYFKAADAGGSMFVHIFGAYFGLAVSFAFGMKERPADHLLEGSTYQSDMFAMIGTIFLWLFWPSFNSATLQGDIQHRAIINTLLAMAASCVISFAVSALVSKEHKFNMVHVQNSTLAGGVGIGTAAGMICQPTGALIIGAASGALSVIGYKYLTPLIRKHWRIHDTCGVHNLHGMPGVVAGMFGVLMSAIANENVYKSSLYQIFPARAPRAGDKLADLQNIWSIDAGLDRTAAEQAGYQFLALVVTLVNALIFGVITGLILRMDICGSVSEADKFNDSLHWELENDGDSENVVAKTRDNHSTKVEQIPMGHI